MWRWNSLMFLVLLYKYSASQPVTDGSTNDRPSRQLDFEECCPCFDKSEVNLDAEEPMGAGSEHVFSRLRHVDDCPCRPRLADPEGASSVFFPTAMRAAGTFLRPGEKKEDLKPLFNPEVDLASSVLQTLREATDEEYQDALARDAAKSAMKAAEDFVFGDATPQESANVVTIVVHPKSSLTGDDHDDDAIPQASNIKHTRCIPPLLGTRSSLGKMRLAAKPSLLLHKPRLPNLKTGLLHRNFYDMDNGMSASNVHEHIVPINEGEAEIRSNTSPLRVVENKNGATASKTDADNCNLGKVPDFRSSSVQNKLKNFDLGKSSLLQSIRDKTINSLSRVPKLSLGSLLADKTSNDMEDLSPASSTIQEQATKKIPYFRNNLPIQNFSPKKPLSVANLLNLRDVELIPLKDLIKKRVEINNNNKSRLDLPIFSRDEEEHNKELFNRNSEDAASKLTPQFIHENNVIEIIADDPEVSPSVLNIKMSPKDERLASDNCQELLEGSPDVSAVEQNNKVTSTEILDTIPSSSKVEPSQGLIESSKCIGDGSSEQDTITDTSNTMNSIVEQHPIEEERSLESLKDQNETDNESCVQDEQINDSRKIIDEKPKLKLLDTSAVDKTFLNIKENIAKKLEGLKNIKSSIKNVKGLNRETTNDEKDNEDIAMDNEDKLWSKMDGKENKAEDCQNEASFQITTVASDVLNGISEDIITTSKPNNVERSEENTHSSDILDNSSDVSQCSDGEVSFQDLQKLSDSMLQQEEQERESKAIESKSSEVIVVPLEKENREGDMFASNKYANTPLSNVVKLDSSDNFQEENDEQKACQSNLALPKTSVSSQTDNNVEASDSTAVFVPNENKNIGSQQIFQPTLFPSKKLLPDINNVLKLPPINPLPTLDDIKERLTSLFDKDDRDVEKISSMETKHEPKMLDISNPAMATDASTSSFQTRPSPSRYLQDINFDILELKPQSSQLPNLPKIGLHSYKAKLPLPKDLTLKPIKLQSALENKGGLLGATLSIGDKNNLLEMRNKASSGISPLGAMPRFNEFRDPLDLPLEATNHIHTTLKNTHKALEAKLRKATNRNLNMLKKPFRTPSVLETLSRNHEDINDKLKGLHMDLNDRLETMRNELIDRSKQITSGSHNIQPIFKSSNDFNILKKDKHPSKSWQASTRREFQKPRKSIRPKPAKLSASPKSIGQKKLRMSTAASVPVPKTMQVPELKTTLTKSSPFSLQRESSTVSSWNVDAPTKPILGQSNHLQSSNTLLGKQLNPIKDSKIKVSFSTTPRPVMVTGKLRSTLPRLQNGNIGKSRDKFGSKMIHQDHSGSPSEIIQSEVAAPTLDHFNRQKYSKLEINDIPRLTSSSENNNLKTPQFTKSIGKSALQAWPKAHDSSFLTKVREAVQTRLSKMNSAKTLKQAGRPLNVSKDDKQVQVQEPQLDMAKSASENKENIHELAPLKENVSYKCKMMCTKE